MGPLSGKQQREYLKFQNKEAREQAKMGLDESRKQQLHQLKLRETAAKANQVLGYKEQVNNAKLKDMGVPLPKGATINKQRLGIPSTNPMAGTEMFKQGQHSLNQSPIFKAQGTDTVPAMLTPGEAVIPQPAAQNPKNKKAIKRMVQEGRKANMRDGAVDVRYSDAPGQAKYHADGISGVPSLAYHHPDVPGSSFMHGTMSVPDFSRGSSAQANYANGSYGVVPQQVQSAAGYEDGTEEVEKKKRGYGWGRDNMMDDGRSKPVTSSWGGENRPKVVTAPLASTAVDVSMYDPNLMSSNESQPVITTKAIPVAETKVIPAVTPGPPGINLTSVQKPLSSIDDYDTYNLFVNAESSGANKAKNPLSTASGLLQFTKDTWEGDAKKGTGIKNQVPELANVKFGSPEFYEEANQRLGFNHLNKQNEARLVKDKLPVSNLSRYSMWQLGSDNGPKVLSNPKASFKESLTNADAILKANPQFAGFKTNQDYINWAESYLNKKAGVGAGPGRGQIDPPIITQATQTNVAPDAVPQQSVAVPEKQLDIPPVEGTGFFQKQSQDKFNMLGVESKKELDTVNQAVTQATQMQGTPEEKKGFLANALAGIFGPKGLFSDKELVRFGLLAAGGMLTGGSVGGSLKFAGLNALQSADRRQAEQFAAEQQEKRFTQQEELLDKRFDKEREFKKQDLIRAEDKQLETEMIREGRDSVAVRNWIKGGQKGEAPEIKTSYIRNGKSELMTVNKPTEINGQVFKPGDPVWVYETVQQVGPRKGETVQMARVGDKSIPFDRLMSSGAFLDKWDSSKYGDLAKTKRAQEFSEKLSKNIFEPIVESYFGASNVKGKANPERKGIVTAGSAASQVESYFRNKKIDLDDRAVQNEIEKITTIASEQLVKDIESGTYKVSKDITPYLAAGEFRERGKLSDKLVTLDKKSGKIMSADDILALRDSANTFISKNKANTSPDAEIARLAEVWTANSNGIQNKYKNSDRNTAFALFALDTFKK